MKAPSVLLVALLAAVQAGAQVTSPPACRLAGATDLDTWSRQDHGGAGAFTLAVGGRSARFRLAPGRTAH